MTIETKFNTNKIVWRFYLGKPKQSTIRRIEILCQDDMVRIYYWVDAVTIPGNKLNESELFATKEELLKSL